MPFCDKCGNQLNDGAKFCPNCGKRTNGNGLVSISFHKNTLIIAAVIVVLGIIILSSALKNGKSRSTSSNSDTPYNMQTSAKDSNDNIVINYEPDADEAAIGIDSASETVTDNQPNYNEPNYVGDSEVTYEIKDGLIYYTSSDKNWTVQENSFSAYFNGERIDVGATFNDNGSWATEIRLARSTFLVLAIKPNIPNITHGSIFSLGDMGVINKGAPVQVYIREEGVVTGHLFDDFHLSTAYIPEENTDYQRAFDTCELQIDC